MPCVCILKNICYCWQWLGADKLSKHLVIETTANQVKYLIFNIGEGFDVVKNLEDHCV